MNKVDNRYSIRLDYTASDKVFNITATARDFDLSNKILNMVTTRLNRSFKDLAYSMKTNGRVHEYLNKKNRPTSTEGIQLDSQLEKYTVKTLYKLAKAQTAEKLKSIIHDSKD